MALQRPDSSCQVSEGPGDHLHDVVPRVWPDHLAGQGGDWKAQPLVVLGLPWQVDRKTLSALGPIPVAWDTVSPEADADQLASSLCLAALQVLLRLRVHAEPGLQYSWVSQSRQDLYALVGQHEGKLLNAFLTRLRMLDPDAAEVQAGPLVALGVGPTQVPCSVVACGWPPHGPAP